MSSTSGAIRAGRAFVELFADDTKLAKGLKMAQAKLRAFSSFVMSIGKQMSIAGAAITTPLIGFAKVWAASGESMYKMSQRLGMSVESLTSFRLAVMMSGSEMGTFEGGIRRMQRTLAAAAKGSPEASDALAQLGLTIEDFKGKETGDQIKLVAEGISKIGSQSQRTAVSMQILGRGAATLIPMMREGAKGMEAWQAQNTRLGFTMSTETAKAADKLNDTLSLLGMMLKSVGTSMGKALGDDMTRWSEWAIEAGVSVKAFINAHQGLIVSIFKGALALSAGGLAVIGLAKGIGLLGTAVGLVSKSLVILHVTAGVALTVLTALPIALAAIGIGALAVEILYYTGALGAVYSWLGDTFGWLRDTAVQAFKGIGDAMNAGDIALAARILWLALQAVWNNGTLGLRDAWTSLMEFVIDAWNTAGSVITDMATTFWYGLRVAWTEGAAALKKIWAGAMTAHATMVEAIAVAANTPHREGDWDKNGKFVETPASIAKNKDNDAYAEKQHNAALDKIAVEYKASLDAIEGERKFARGKDKEAYEKRKAEIAKEFADRKTRVAAEREEAARLASGDYAQAMEELNAVTGQASDAAANRPGLKLKLKSDRQDESKLDDLLINVRQKVEARGTFNAAATQGMGSGGMMDRIAQAAERQVKVLEEMWRRDQAEAAADLE